MNRRQVQRALAEVLTKSQDLHVDLPLDAFDGLASAGEALRHSRVGGKYHFDDAVDELKQRYGLEAKWQQLEDASESKRRSRQKRHRLRRGVENKASGTVMTSDTDSADAATLSPDPEVRARKKPRTSATGSPRHGSSRIQRIIENNPAKNPANEELAEEFVELGRHELEHGAKQKGISRMAVAKQIREASQPITSGEQVRRLPHVGPSAAAKIDEVLHRGKMKALEEYEAEKQEADDNSAAKTARKANKAEGGGGDLAEPKPRGEEGNAGQEEDEHDAEHEEAQDEVHGARDADDEEDNDEDEDDEQDEDEGEEPEDKNDEDWQDEQAEDDDDDDDGDGD